MLYCYVEKSSNPLLVLTLWVIRVTAVGTSSNFSNTMFVTSLSKLIMTQFERKKKIPALNI